MRPLGLAALAAGCAVLGGATALAVGEAGGWLGRGAARAVVITETRAPVAPSFPAARPLTGSGFDPAGIYALRSPGVVTIFSVFQNGDTSQGSGFVVSGQGYVLTSSHVVTDAGQRPQGENPRAAEQVFVEFADRDRVSAKVVGFDLFDDVGLLRVDPAQHALAPVPLGDSSAVRVGEPVAAIGSPFGNETSLAVGVVSATHRAIGSLTSAYDLPGAIQVDAPINHGNSGGPVFDARGRVIGIAAQIRSTSGNAEGVGFAVPIDAARRSMHELVATGRVAYAYVGIVTEDVTPSVARRLGLSVRQGAILVSVRRGTAAAHAGLRGGTRDLELNGRRIRAGGDVLVSIDGRPVASSEDVLRIVTEHLRPGKPATFTVVRDGRRLNVRLVLDERPVNPNAG